jgi:hypothetical protein
VEHASAWRAVYEKGFAVMSATTSNRSATSKRATSRSFRRAACVSGASGPFSAASASNRFVCGVRKATPVRKVAANPTRPATTQN